jgi:hypothetical protein
LVTGNLGFSIWPLPSLDEMGNATVVDGTA